MESTTPTSARPSRRNRSSSRTRPTTPLRAASRTSLRASTTTPTHASSSATASSDPLAFLEPAFAEFSDSMADLEANMLHLQLLQESLTRFNENFGGFLYGMNMNAFTVDFTEAPGPESFRRAAEKERDEGQHQARFGFGGDHAGGHGQVTGGGLGRDVDATFLTSDTSFVENPPTPRTTRTTSKFATPARQSTSASARPAGTARAGGAMGRREPPSTAGTARTKGAPVVRGTRASQLAASRRETIAARGRGRGAVN